jgi:hypothetical protein
MVAGGLLALATGRGPYRMRYLGAFAIAKALVTIGEGVPWRSSKRSS